MIKKRLPTLSTVGVIEDDDTIVNRLFLYFLTSEFSQTFFYEGYVGSLKYIIGKYGNDETEFKNKLKEALINMYDRYYSSTEVSISIGVNSESESIKIVDIDIITYNEGKELSLSKTIQIDKDKLIYLNEHLEDLYKSKR